MGLSEMRILVERDWLRVKRSPHLGDVEEGKEIALSLLDILLSSPARERDLLGRVSAVPRADRHCWSQQYSQRSYLTFQPDCSPG